MRSRFTSVFFLLLIVLSAGLFTLPVSAARHPASSQPASPDREKPYALIFGTVWGPDDHPIYGVKVKIRRAKDKKAKWELYSDHNGEFAQRVPAGENDYILWADLKGFKLASGQRLRPVQEVTVHIYNDERQDTSLHLAVVEK
jgi:hypothetical protein